MRPLAEAPKLASHRLPTSRFSRQACVWVCRTAMEAGAATQPSRSLLQPLKCTKNSVRCTRATMSPALPCACGVSSGALPAACAGSAKSAPRASRQSRWASTTASHQLPMGLLASTRSPICGNLSSIADEVAEVQKRRRWGRTWRCSRRKAESRVVALCTLERNVALTKDSARKSREFSCARCCVRRCARENHAATDGG